MATEKPYQAGPFLGINNKLPVEKLVGEKGAFVRDAVNVDLNDAGAFQRRPGETLIEALVRGRSLWADGDIGYFADGAKLKSFDGIDVRDVADLTSADANVSFTNTPRGVIWTDGAQLQLIAGGASTELTVAAPNPVPQATAVAGGAMQAGLYSVGFANVNAAGERSELTDVAQLQVPDNGAIDFVFPAGRAHDTEVYVTAAGGSQLFREMTVPASDTTARLAIVTTEGQPLSDDVELPIPPGDMVREYRGRLITVVGQYVFYSLAYTYGRYLPAWNYIAHDGDVTLCEPCEEGVYLATAKKTWFLRGPDIAGAELTPLAPYGAISNTVANEPNSNALWWSSPRGAVRANGGAIELKQDANIAFGNATAGAALFREENGLSQLVSVLANVKPTGAASASSYMDAEVIN